MMTKGKRSELEKKAANLISKSLTRIVRKKGKAVMAIPGGTSVKSIFELLKHKDVPWKKIHIFMVDERLVPINNMNSNYKLAFDSFTKELLAKKKITLENVHPFIYTGKIKEDLKKYEQKLKLVRVYFDIVLLSAGEDGHIASLFPNHETINSDARFFVSTKSSPKPPRGRVSSSRKLLLKSKIAVLLFFGKSKKEAFRKFKESNSRIENCPARLVKQIKKNYVFVDLT